MERLLNSFYNPFSQHSKANYLLTKQVKLHQTLTAQLITNPSSELQSLRNEQIQLQINSLLEANYQLRKAFQIQDHKLPQAKGVVFIDNNSRDYRITYKTPTIAHTFAPFMVKAISAYNHNITQSKLADLSILLDTPVSDPDALTLHSVLSTYSSDRPFYITTNLPTPTLEALARFHKTDIFYN